MGVNMLADTEAQNEEAPAEPCAQVDEVDASARLDGDAVRLIVGQITEHLALWRVETEASHSKVEAKLRRERAMGALLFKLKGAGLLNQGGRPPKEKTNDMVSSVSLEDLKIKAEQSSRWQLEAELPEDKFVQWIKDTRSRGDEISSAGLRKCATEYVKLRAGVVPPDEFDNVAEIDDGTGPCATCGGTGRVAF